MNNNQKKVTILAVAATLVLASVFLFQTTSYASNGTANVSTKYVVVVDGSEVVVSSNSFGTATAKCPRSDVATGGGYSSGFVGTPIKTNTIQSSIPTPTTTGSTPTGWEIDAVNNSPNSIALQAYVVCLGATK